MKKVYKKKKFSATGEGGSMESPPLRSEVPTKEKLMATSIVMAKRAQKRPTTVEPLRQGPQRE